VARVPQVAGGSLPRLTPVLAGTLVSAVAGALVHLLWPVVGLPPRGEPLDAPFPGVWRWFFSVWLPVMFPVFTLAHEGLLQRCHAEGLDEAPARRACRWDRWSYALLPAFLVGMTAWPLLERWGGWRWSLAAFYVAVLFGKVLTILIVGSRARVLPPGRADDRAVGAYLFGIPFALYVLSLAYVVTALSTAGDEHIYLLNTHSLYVDHDVYVGNNIAQRDYARFYWGRASPSAWHVSFVGFPAFLLPGYALGAALLPGYPPAGRLGATLTIAACGALLALHAYRLCRDVGASAPAAGWAWLLVAFTPPVLINAAHVYPELPAAALAVISVRAALRLPSRPWPALGIVVGAAAVLVALKDRYAPVSLWLVGWAVVRLARGRLALGALLLAGTGLVGVYLLAVDPARWLFPNLVSAGQLRAHLLEWNRWMPQAAVGLLADQEFGLLYYGPHWLLAAPGFVLLWRRRRGLAVALAGLALFYLFVVVKYRWMQWDAGWTPPPRFTLVVAPVLAPFIAEVFDHCRGKALAAVNTVWLVWSGAVGFCLVLVPFWRYNDLDGRSTLLQVAGGAMGLDLARFLPSLRAPTPWTWAVLGAGGVAILAAGAYCATRRRVEAPPWGPGQAVLA
jgi:hypothetical protein